jgi:hypothetical protein
MIVLVTKEGVVKVQQVPSGAEIVVHHVVYGCDFVILFYVEALKHVHEGRARHHDARRARPRSDATDGL